jgi:hypothetical protein
MLTVEWSCLEAVTHLGGFLHPMLKFVKIVSIGSKTNAKCTHALCYLDTLVTLGARRIIARGDIDRGVVGLYLAHSRDAGGTMLTVGGTTPTTNQLLSVFAGRGTCLVPTNMVPWNGLGKGVCNTL